MDSLKAQYQGRLNVFSKFYSQTGNAPSPYIYSKPGVSNIQNSRVIYTQVDNSATPEWGQEMIFKIQDYGDLLYNLRLRVDLGPLQLNGTTVNASGATTTYALANAFGVEMIARARLVIDNSTKEIVYPRVKFLQDVQFDRNCGDLPTTEIGYYPTAFSTTSANWTPLYNAAAQSNSYVINLPFFFNKSKSKAFRYKMMRALRDNNLRICVTLNDFYNLVIPSSGGSITRTANPGFTMAINNFQLISDRITLMPSTLTPIYQYQTVYFKEMVDYNNGATITIPSSGGNPTQTVFKLDSMQGMVNAIWFCITETDMATSNNPNRLITYSTNYQYVNPFMADEVTVLHQLEGYLYQYEIPRREYGTLPAIPILALNFARVPELDAPTGAYNADGPVHTYFYITMNGSFTGGTLQIYYFRDNEMQYSQENGGTLIKVLQPST